MSVGILYNCLCLLQVAGEILEKHQSMRKIQTCDFLNSEPFEKTLSYLVDGQSPLIRAGEIGGPGRDQEGWLKLYADMRWIR